MLAARRTRSWFIQLMKGASVSFLIRLIGLVLAFLVNLVLARSMSVSDFGSYAFIVNVVGITSAGVLLGCDQATIRFLPGYLERNCYGEVRKYVQFSLTIVACLSLVLMAGYAIWQTAMVPSLAMLDATILVPCILLPLCAITRFFQQVTRSAKQIASSQMFEQVMLPAGLIAACLAIRAGGREISYFQIITVQAILYGVITLIMGRQVWALCQASASTIAKPLVKDTAKTWLAVAIPLGFAEFAGLLVARVDIVFLGVLVNEASVAEYSVAVRIAGVMIFGLSAADAIAAPMLAEQHANADEAAMTATFTIAALISLVASFVLMLVIILTGDFLLGLFGKAYHGADKILFILAFAKLIQAAFGPIGMLLCVTGNHMYYMFVRIIVAACAVGILPVAIKLFGSVGAACVTAILTVVWCAALTLIAYRRTGIGINLRSLRTSGATA